MTTADSLAAALASDECASSCAGCPAILPVIWRQARKFLA